MAAETTTNTKRKEKTDYFFYFLFFLVIIVIFIIYLFSGDDTQIVKASSVKFETLEIMNSNSMRLTPAK